jgi:transmembrane sensor
MTDRAPATPPFDFETFDRYLAGECTPDEVTAFETLAQSSGGLTEAARRLNELRSAFAMLPQEPTREGIAASFAALSVKIGQGTGDRGFAAKRVGRSHVREKSMGVEVRTLRGDGFLGKQTLPRGFFSTQALWSRLRVSVVGAAIIVLGISLWLRQTPTTPITSSVYRTRSAEVIAVRLANGNRVTLAPRSTLTLQGTRATLVGQALFTIAHQEKTPFVVHTGLISVRVLGTAFDVRHYSDDRETQVVVLAGKVETRTKASSRTLTMTAGQMALVSDSSVVRATDFTNATRWTAGQLAFTEARVCEVLRAVGQWYGYTFRLSGRDSLALTQQHITAILDGRSVADAVHVLSGLLNATATVDSTTTGRPVITLHVNASARAGAASVPERRKSLGAFTTSGERGR